MKKLHTHKGITLIALIITIIILLILAVVAISAVQGDGIIAHAKNARDEYGKAQTNEADTLAGYLSSMDEAINGTKVANGPVELVTYILGAEKKGRDMTEIVDLSTYAFKDDETTTDVNEAEVVTTLNLGWNADNTIGYGYIKYDNVAYKVGFKGNSKYLHDSTSYTTDSLEEIYTPQGREGTTVQYDSNGDDTPENWIIITDRDGKVEIVSESVMGSLTMGGSDAEIKGNLLKYLDLNGDNIPDDLDGDGTIEEGGTDLDGDGTAETDYQDIAIASYNNAITTVNEYCKSLVTAETDKTKVRSVGGTNNTASAYSSTNFNSWFKGSASAACGDIQYEQDFVKLSYWGKVATTEEYTLASRIVYENSSYVNFYLRYVREGSLSDYNLWYVYSDGGMYGSNPSFGVRPVVINPSGI